MFKKLFNFKETYKQVSSENIVLYDSLLLKILEEKQDEAKKTGSTYSYDVKLPSLESYQKIKKFNLIKKREFAYWIVQKMVFLEKARGKKDYFLSDKSHLAIEILNNIFRGNLGFNEEDFMFFFEFFKTQSFSINTGFFHWPTSFLAIQIERYQKKNELSNDFNTYLTKLLKDKVFTASTYYYKDEINKIKNRINKILQNQSEVVISFIFSDEDKFGVASNKLLSSYTKEQQVFLSEILEKCRKVTNAKPTKKFTTETSKIIDKLNAVTYKKFLKEIFTNVNVLEVTTIEHRSDHDTDYVFYENKFLENQNATTIKGLLWTATRFHEKELLSLIAKLCIKTFKKIPGKGPAAAAVGNASIYYLSKSKGLDGVAQLTVIKQKITQKSTKDLIDKYITEISDKYGISKADLEESVVPDFKLNLGEKSYKFNDYTLKINIERIGKVALKWINTDGKIQKTAPSFIKNNKTLSDKLKKVKIEIKEIQKFVTVQKNRLDTLLIDEKIIPFTNFNTYYFNHGLVSFITRKLIWIVTNKKQKTIVLFFENQWIDENKKPINWIDENTTFQLWHPIYDTTETIIKWRNFLMDNQITQPLKQAFREIYLLTEAEINTKIYSNRMAAHILKQHQFNTLAKMRGWNYQLIGAWDHGSDCIASRKLTNGLTAEFWLNEIYDDDQFNDAGILYYMATDQVRFIKDNDETVDLIDIPKIIFTEIMRDVDLFVGVASVGNDPQWRDNSGLPQYRDYWTSYSFGNLTEVAKTRKTILEGLIPRLKIKDVAKIDGKFLIVKGNIRTYKIHIGSTNILMEPNDQYLCIVPSHKKNVSKDVFLPFDGDKGLSVILSKAFMLADDLKITDQTILSQIR